MCYRFTFELVKLDQQTHIYFKSVLPGKRVKVHHTAIPLSLFKNSSENTSLKIRMHTQLDAGHKISMISPGHTSPIGV